MESPHHDKDYIVSQKRKIALFLYRWVNTIRVPVLNDHHATAFIEVNMHYYYILISLKLYNFKR